MLEGPATMSTVEIEEWLALAIVLVICGVLAALLFRAGPGDDGSA